MSQTLASLLNSKGQRFTPQDALVSGCPRGWRCSQCGLSVHVRPSKKSRVVVTHFDGRGACLAPLGLKDRHADAIRAAHALALTWRIPLEKAKLNRKWAHSESVVERVSAVPSEVAPGRVLLLVQTYVRVLVLELVDLDTSRAHSLPDVFAGIPWLRLRVKSTAWADILEALEADAQPATWAQLAPQSARVDEKWKQFDAVWEQLSRPGTLLENRQSAHYNLLVPQTLKQVSQDMKAYAIANKLPKRVVGVLQAWEHAPKVTNAYGEKVNPFEDSVDTRPEQVPLAWIYFRVCLEGLHTRGLCWTRHDMAVKLARELLLQSSPPEEIDPLFGVATEAEREADLLHNAELLEDSSAAGALSLCIDLLLSQGCVEYSDLEFDQLRSKIALT